MKLLTPGKWIACSVLACFAIGAAPYSRAESPAHVEKHARKVEKKLAKYRPGTYLHLIFRDQTDSVGSLGALSATSFAFTNADTNATRSYHYVDVASVEKGSEYIGEGSVRRHHFPLLIPAIIVSGAAAAAAAVLATR
ncbi:MAG TPA: hypothetical protein VMA34_10875 [Terracidiphilus sp.]|nr:hypothetical protein [Terracidiphilus sp.]